MLYLHLFIVGYSGEVYPLVPVHHLLVVSVELLKPKSPQSSFYGSYLYDRIIPQDHLLRKINQVGDFSFVHDLVKGRYNPDSGRPAEDPEFMLRLCLLRYLYGDLTNMVIYVTPKKLTEMIVLSVIISYKQILQK